MIESLVAILLLLTIALLRPAQQPPEAAQGRRAVAEGHDRGTDHRDRDRRARDRRPEDRPCASATRRLGERLRARRAHVCPDLERQIKAGDVLLGVSRIAGAGAAAEASRRRAPDAKAVAAAAQAFAERTRATLGGLAA